MPRGTNPILVAGLLLSACGGRVAMPDPDCRLPPVEEPSEAGPPTSLLATGLYCDGPGDLRRGLVEYRPRFARWSDGAEARRFIRLPPGEVIDTADDASWSFPVGTRLWKEFVVDGLLVETRLIERWGEGANDWNFAAFLWRDDDSDADVVPAGVSGARGTSHDVPDVGTCISCHGNRAERVLGFSAVQLGDPDRLASLSALFPAPHAEVSIPGGPPTREALGYLHANCGFCHRSHDASSPPLALDLEPGLTEVAETAAYRTAVGVRTVGFHRGTFLAAPGSPDDSAIVQRMSARGDITQMPPIGTERVDDVGVRAVRRWIEELQGSP